MEDMLLQKRVCTVGKMTVKQPLYVRGKQHKITDPDHDRDYNAVDVNQTKFESSIFEGLSRYGLVDVELMTTERCTWWTRPTRSTISTSHL